MGCSSHEPYPPPQKIEDLHALNTQLNRVKTITHNIFIASSTLCQKLSPDYGFISMATDEDFDEKQKKLWVEAFNLYQQPTITYIVPNGAADKVGLLVGDVIISINNISRSEIKTEKEFAKILDKARKLPSMHLGVLRNEKIIMLPLIANMACDCNFILNYTTRHLASAQDKRINIDFGLTTLLKSDDELAYIISHELAHILLGHTLPERKIEIDNYNMRSVIEKDADALGIRLMINAGYNHNAAQTALKKTGLIDSGPITRFLNYHGPYMPTDERIQYIKKVIDSF